MVSQSPIVRPRNPGRAAMLAEFGVKRHARVVFARLRATARRAARAATGKSDDRTPIGSVYGVDLVANFSDKTFRYCLYGTYGKYFSSFLKSQDKPFTFVDIGANQGLYSLIAGINRNCTHVVAFEPVSGTHMLLSQNLAANGLSEKATAVNAGVSDRSGSGAIATKPGHSGVASLDRPGAEGFGEAEEIALVDGSDLAALLPGDGPIIIKIDVEGHEATVVKTLVESTFIDRVAAIFYEMDERWVDAGPVRAMLEQVGFASFHKHGMGRHYDVMALRGSDTASAS